MLLESKRLLIRPWQATDFVHYMTMSKDVGYNCFSTPGYFSVKSEAEAKEKVLQRIKLFEDTKAGKFVVLLKSTEEFLGTAGIDPYTLAGREEFELGYRLCLKYWGQGFATEAGEMILDYGFNELRLSKLIAFAVPQNPASLKVIEKLGFTYLQIIDHAGFPHKLYEKHK